jgi:hypothetical protein
MVPVLEGLLTKIAVNGIFSRLANAIAYSLEGFNRLEGSTGNSNLSNISGCNQRNVYLTLPSERNLKLYFRTEKAFGQSH